ncbi:MAG: PH domain-containing protein [Acidimicrobiia bacterium]
MAFPHDVLNEGEELALDLRPHWWYFWKHAVLGVLLFIAFILMFQLSGTPKKLLAPVLAIAAVVWAVWLVLKYFQWTYTHFVVTSDRVIWRTGVIARHGVEIPLENVNNINFKQGIFERMIGAGDLIIESAGKEGQSDFDNVRHPDRVQQEIYRQMEVNAKKTASYSRPEIQHQDSIPAQIEHLARLRDQGVLTPEEFEAKKQDLLNRM